MFMIAGRRIIIGNRAPGVGAVRPLTIGVGAAIIIGRIVIAGFAGIRFGLIGGIVGDAVIVLISIRRGKKRIAAIVMITATSIAKGCCELAPVAD
nr:hypothetical protein [Methylomarinum sp. Ch1-1]MDP4522746.1 hypothetical protein [Methylomarinum sp. Ch1-1]